MEIEDLKDGDILLFKEDTITMVKTAQFFLRLNPIKWLDKGSISTVHAGIVVDVQKANSFMGAEFEIAHATDGVKTTWIRKDGEYKNYKFDAYRCVRKERAQEARSVGKLWTSGSKTMPYAKFSKVVGAAFHSSGYTNDARKRARFYAQHKNTPGGPPGIAKKKKGMYCSMFVIACYQAVFGESESAVYMPLDAKNTSPMTLESWLKDNRAWEFVGSMDL